MSKEIQINAFSGMNNLKSSGRFVDSKGVAEPRAILNADVDPAGELEKRSGKTLIIPLPGARSVWAGSRCVLCRDSSHLYRLNPSHRTKEQIVEIEGTGEEYLSYEEADGKVFISNSYWKGIFDPADNSIMQWGVDLPPGPMLLSVSGNLPAGTYHVTFTNVSGDELSGNGPVSEIELTGDDSGIQILNRPAGAIVWATEANEPIFFRTGAVDCIVDIPSVEPLPSFMVSPPPNMTCLCFAFGRMWGGAGNSLYYSEPYKPSWFKTSENYFKFESEVVLIARVPTGLFVGLKSRTVFLGGTEPEQMAQATAGAGSIRGTLKYANNLPELGDILGTPEKGYVDVPVWRTTEGIVAGNAAGRLFNLSKNKLKMPVPDYGASLYRKHKGRFQFLTGSPQGLISSAAGASDELSVQVFRNGRLLTS